jgi:hypothetical protein
MAVLVRQIKFSLYNMIRIDFIFSYWIFAWYLLYMMRIVKYSPKFAILCGIIENLIILSAMFYYKTRWVLGCYFCIMFLLLKIIPWWTIRNDVIRENSVLMTLLLFGIYLVWMMLNNQKSSTFIRHTRDLVIKNKNTLPGMVFIEKLFYTLI